MLNCEEVKIDVPWGHISGKSWGHSNDEIIFLFHGIMDNAGSFDRLIPLLPKGFRYIAFDLPGHGRSSYFPSYFPAYSINNVIVYKIIADYYKQQQYIIIGHSFGAQVAITFTQLYPEYVKKIVVLDTVHLYPTLPGQFKSNLRERLDFVMKLPSKKRPSYTFEETLDKLQNQRFTGTITREAAMALHPRAIEQLPDGRYSFTVDPRLRNFINPIYDFAYITKILKKFPIKCPMLFLMARETDLQRVYFKDVIKVYKTWRNVKVKVVEGNHDVHNNQPEVVAPHISEFLLKSTSKL